MLPRVPVINQKQPAISNPTPAPSSALGKVSRDEIDDRRRKVLRLRMRGLGYRTIAKLVGVGHMTVKRDLEAIKEENREKVGKLTKVDHVSEALTAYQEVELRAWQDYHEAKAGSKERQAFLREVRDSRRDQTKLLTDLGLIEKTPHETHVKVSAEVIRHWSVEAQDLVAMAMLQSQMGSNNGKKVLEAHAEPVIEPATEGDKSTET